MRNYTGRPKIAPVTIEKALTYGLPLFVRHLIEITPRQQQTQPTLLHWLRVECPENEERRIQKAKAAVIFTVQPNRDGRVVKSLERRVPDGR